MRPEARFHDGSPITADDVVFTLDTLKGPKAYATYRLLLQKVLGATAVSRHEVEIRFAPDRSRELPLIVAGLPIFSKAYSLPAILMPRRWKVRWAPAAIALTDRAGAVDQLSAGCGLLGKDLPVSVGQSNFDVVRYEYFRDRKPPSRPLRPGSIRSAMSSPRSSGPPAMIFRRSARGG